MAIFTAMRRAASWVMSAAAWACRRRLGRGTLVVFQPPAFYFAAARNWVVFHPPQRGLRERHAAKSRPLFSKLNPTGTVNWPGDNLRALQAIRGSLLILARVTHMHAPSPFCGLGQRPVGRQRSCANRTNSESEFGSALRLLRFVACLVCRQLVIHFGHLQ